MQLPKFPLYQPFFIFDISNSILITSTVIPSDISDTKQIILAEIQIPGLNYQPVHSGGMGNRKLSFTLQLIKRDDINGNTLALKQFDNLRQPSFSYENVFKKAGQFTPNPKVLYSYGTGSIPLVYYVSKCDFSHKQGWVNAFGYPQYSEISMELTLDESNPINRGEELFRKLSSISGQFSNSVDLSLNYAGRRPY